MRLSLAVILAGLSLAGAHPARGTPPDLDGWRARSRLTGDWGGLRTRLERRGISVAGGYTLDWSKPFANGLRDRDTAQSLLDLNASFDLESILKLRGATLFIDGYAHWGRSATEDAGDFQGFNNIDSDRRIQIAELWVEKILFGDRLRLKLGKVDANSEFAFVAGDFIHSSPGFSPTIFPMPSYPDPAMSANLFVYPTSSFYVGAGVYDGALNDGVPTGRRGPKTFFSDSKSNDYFLIGELGILWDEAWWGGEGRLAAGPWHHTGDFERWSGGTQDGSSGFFVVVEQRLWHENFEAEDDDQGVSAFFQYGYAEEDVSEAAHHAAFGAVWTGLPPGRDGDAVGLMLSWVDLSDAPAADFDANETAVELFYLLPRTGFFALKADLQCIVNPSGRDDAGALWVGTRRLEVSL